MKERGRVKVTAKSKLWIPSVPHTEPESTVSLLSEFIILELFRTHHMAVWSKFMSGQSIPRLTASKEEHYLRNKEWFAPRT